MSNDEHGELSDLERQVALLVAWGGSNRDVAEALGIDAKSVERHLARVYRKHGIRSGTALLVMEGPSRDAVPSDKPHAGDPREQGPAGIRGKYVGE